MKKKTQKKQHKLIAPQSKQRHSSPKKINLSRTASGRVPQGRTLTTKDNYLSKIKTKSTKERPVVVIEADNKNNLAVVPLSSREGKDRTQLKKYQQGQSYYKHYVEIEDNEGKPIRVNKKFRENHPNMDVRKQDIDEIHNTVFSHSKPMYENRKKIDKFRGKKNPRD